MFYIYIHTTIYSFVLHTAYEGRRGNLVWFQRIYFTKVLLRTLSTQKPSGAQAEQILYLAVMATWGALTAHRATPWLYHVRQHLLIHNFELGIPSPGPQSPPCHTGPYTHAHTRAHTHVHTHTTLHLFLPPLLPSSVFDFSPAVILCIWCPPQTWSFVLRLSFWSFITDASKH